MKSKKITAIIASVMVVSVMATLAVSTTIARYASTVSGKDTATVANFSFEARIDGKTLTEDEPVVVGKLLDQDIIAPGDNGSMQFVFINTSDVSVNFAITDLGIELPENSNIPFILKYKGNYYSDSTVTGYNYYLTKEDKDAITISGTIEELLTEINDETDILVDGINKSRTLGYVWPFITTQTVAGVEEEVFDDFDYITDDTVITMTPVVTATQID